MSEIAKCAWCGKEPVGRLRSSDSRQVFGCGTLSPICPNFLINGMGAYEWNLNQARILEARRKDFEAGVSATLGTKMSWQDRDSWFDDYIKETK